MKYILVSINAMILLLAIFYYNSESKVIEDSDNLVHEYSSRFSSIDTLQFGRLMEVVNKFHGLPDESEGTKIDSVTIALYKVHDSFADYVNYRNDMKDEILILSDNIKYHQRFWNYGLLFFAVILLLNTAYLVVFQKV